MKLNKQNAIAFFARLFQSEHAIPSKVRKLNEGGYYILTEQQLATFDSDLLTTLVFLAHEWGYKAIVKPEDSLRLMIAIQKRKRHPNIRTVYQTWVEENEPSDAPPKVDKPLPVEAPKGGFVTLQNHPNLAQIMAGIPANVRRMIEQGMKKGLTIRINDQGFLALPPELNKDFQALDYQHMCEKHPEFATAFKSYLNGMSIAEAVEAAHRDLDPPGCIAPVLDKIGSYYMSLPDDQRE